MKLEGVRIKAVLVVFIVVMGLALFGQYFAHQKLVIEPIYQAFSGIEAVEAVELIENDGQLTLTLTLGEVAELDDLVNEILMTAARYSQPFQILIKDTADGKLEAVYHEMHFVIEQGVIHGNFVEMAKEIQRLADAHQVKYRVKVDRGNVYLQLHDQDRYLYQVVSRQDQPVLLRLDS